MSVNVDLVSTSTRDAPAGHPSAPALWPACREAEQCAGSSVRRAVRRRRCRGRSSSLSRPTRGCSTSRHSPMARSTSTATIAHAAGGHDRAHEDAEPLASAQSPSHWRSTSAYPMNPPARPPRRIAHERRRPGGRRRQCRQRSRLGHRAECIRQAALDRPAGRQLARPAYPSAAVRVVATCRPTTRPTTSRRCPAHGGTVAPTLEILIVDDGSPDGTADLAASSASRPAAYRSSSAITRTASVPRTDPACGRP